MNKREIKNIIILVIITIIMIFINFLINGMFDDKISYCKKIYNAVFKKIDINEQLKINETLLGITDVYGEGIILTINDGSDITHQEDVVVLFDELKNAGAEAISINEMRFTNSSYIYCDGNVLLIDGKKIQAPFIIKAIGNKNNLSIGMLRNKGYVEVLKKAGLEVSVEESDNIEIPKYTKVISENYENAKTNIGKIVESDKLIGKTSMNDSGIEITISNKISAIYMMQIINNLKSGGATAISVNNERIVNMTDIVEINETILINSNSISNPYIIKVTGDTQKLLEGMNLANSTINKLKEKGAQIDIKKKKHITINEYVPKRENSKMNLEYVKSK